VKGSEHGLESAGHEEAGKAKGAPHSHGNGSAKTLAHVDLFIYFFAFISFLAGSYWWLVTKRRWVDSIAPDSTLNLGQNQTWRSYFSDLEKSIKLLARESSTHSDS